MYKIDFIPHTADIAIKITAPSLEELFLGSAEAWNRTVLEGNKKTGDKIIEIELEGKTLEELLVNFLNELNFLLLTRKLVFCSVKELRIKEEKNQFGISGKFLFTQFNPQSHTLREEIKAVTYHKMRIKKSGESYTTHVVFDI